MANISNLTVVVGADISDFTRQMDTVQSRINSFGGSIGQSISGLGSQLTNAGTGMSTLGTQLENSIAPLQNFILEGVNVAAAFEDAMVALDTFGGLAGDELETVRQKAMDMGAATKFSSTDAANAMLEIVKSGYSVTDAMTAAEAALNLAAIGNMNMEESAGILTSTLSMFGLPASQANAALDILAGGANASKADVRGLGDALNNVGTVAATMGFSLQETVAALAVLSQNGIMGADAGTQLKSALLSLTTSDTAAQALDKLGVSLYDLDGKMRPLDAIIDDLALAMKDLTPEEQTIVMKDLAGAYGITALSALIAAGGIDTMVSEMEKAPAAADLAQQQMGTFNGKVEGLQGSVENLMINGLTPLKDEVLAPLVDVATKVVNSFSDWIAINPGLATGIGLLVLGMGAFGSALVILGPLVTGFGLLIKGLGFAFTLATSPISWIVLGIGAIIALLSNPDIQNGLKAWEGVFQNFGIVAAAVFDDIAVGVRTFVRDLEEQWIGLQAKIAEAQITVGFNVEGNTDFLEGLASQQAGIDIAQNLETSVNQYLAGQDVNLDIGGLNWAITGEPDPTTGATAPADLAKNILDSIADPMAVEAAMNQAIQSGDVAAINALLPVSLELAEDPSLQMQELLSAALDAGGENSPVFQTLLDTATELDIDVTAIQQQTQDALDASAAGKKYKITIDLDVDVLANVNQTAIGGAAQQAANAMGPNLPPARPGNSPLNMPQLASGGYIAETGLALVHAGEQILNPAQTAAMASGGLGGNTYIINAYGDNPYAVAEMVNRANRDRDR